MTPQSQAKRAVGFGEGRIAVPVMLKTLCTAHSGDSVCSFYVEFVKVLIICPKMLL